MRGRSLPSSPQSYAKGLKAKIFNPRASIPKDTTPLRKLIIPITSRSSKKFSRSIEIKTPNSSSLTPKWPNRPHSSREVCLLLWTKIHLNPRILTRYWTTSWKIIWVEKRKGKRKMKSDTWGPKGKHLEYLTLTWAPLAKADPCLNLFLAVFQPAAQHVLQIKRTDFYYLLAIWIKVFYLILLYLDEANSFIFL